MYKGRMGSGRGSSPRYRIHALMAQVLILIATG